MDRAMHQSLSEFFSVSPTDETSCWALRLISNRLFACCASYVRAAAAGPVGINHRDPPVRLFQQVLHGAAV